METILGDIIGLAILAAMLYPLIRMSMQPAPKETPEQKKAREEMYETAMSVARGRGGYKD